MFAEQEALESKSGSSEPDVESTDSEDDPDEDTAFDLDLRLQSHSEAGPSQVSTARISSNKIRQTRVCWDASLLVLKHLVILKSGHISYSGTRILGV